MTSQMLQAPATPNTPPSFKKKANEATMMRELTKELPAATTQEKGSHDEAEVPQDQAQGGSAMFDHKKKMAKTPGTATATTPTAKSAPVTDVNKSAREIMEKKVVDEKKPESKEASKEAPSKDASKEPIKDEEPSKEPSKEKGSERGNSSQVPNTKKASGKQKKKKQRTILMADTIISSATVKYKVLRVLGSGGFGDVYEVETMDDKKSKFALKTEDVNVDKRLARLKIEAFVLELCSNATSKRHFIRLIDRGYTENKYKFIVMPVVGYTLDKVRKEMLNGHNFTHTTATMVAIQMLESLRDLHALGYLHRDLKPQNFAIGLPPDAATVFMLDFGVARKFLDKENNLAVPRCKVKFMGTIRFAPRSAHRQMDQSRKDDLESLCYVITDIYDEWAILWRGNVNLVELLKHKDSFMRGIGPDIARLFETNQLPASMQRFIAAINEVEGFGTIDYGALVEILKDPKVYKPEEPLDWLNEELKERRKKEKPPRQHSLMKRTATRVQRSPGGVPGGASPGGASGGAPAAVPGGVAM